MKTVGQIAQKLKQAQFRHVKREVRRLMKTAPENCTSNRTLTLDMGPVGVCSLDCQVCDLRFEDRSATCDLFEQKHAADEVKASLREFFKIRLTSEIAVRFPDVAALRWAMQEEEEEGSDWVIRQIATLLGTPVYALTGDEDGEELEAILSTLQEGLRASEDRNMRKQAELDRQEVELDRQKAELGQQKAEMDLLRGLLSPGKEEWEPGTPWPEEDTDEVDYDEVFEVDEYVNHNPWWRRLWPF
jgi:hypothetical protein